jgi:hypothetical protein
VENGTGWVLVEDEPERALGRALLWAGKAPIDALHILAGENAGKLALRASAFASQPSVWLIEGTALTPAEPRPLPDEPPLDPRVSAMADLIRSAGAEPVVEHGVLRAEVLGLEVARVEVDDDGPWLEVGVGKHDRHAQRLVHADEPTREALVRAVATVEGHRRAGAPHHPYNRLAPERWLRAQVVANPALIGAAQLLPVPSPVDRDDLRKPAPAPAAGVDVDDGALLAVFSTGVDVDLVPVAAEARMADNREPRLLIVVPERDDHPYLRPMAQALRVPADVVTVSDDWRML